MKHEKQVEILRELLRQLDEKVNVDAGVMFKNPTSVYTCPDLAKREWETFFRNHPQMIGLSGSLPKPGSYVTVDDFGVPVLATRDKQGRFRAFLNACRHRGVRVANEEKGDAETFMCPFHNWVYSNEGELLGMPQEKHFGQIDRSCHGLVELPAVEHHGFLWVHPRADGELDPEKLLGPLAPEVETWRFGEMVHVAETLIESRLNWKLANDTFGETYHFQKLHKNTLGQIFYGDALAYEPVGRNHRFVFASKGIDSLRELPESDWNLPDAANLLYFLFPNVQFSTGAGTAAVIKIYPDPEDPARSRTRVSHYFRREMLEAASAAGSETHVLTAENTYDYDAASGKDVVFDPSALTEVFDSTIEKEDYWVGEATQRSAESGTLDYLLFGRNEPALHHYHSQYRDALGMPPLEKL